MKIQKGFTLIELLVVVAIIGVLASIALVSLSEARGKARDAKRKSDIKQISLAMEMIYDEEDEYFWTEPDAENRIGLDSEMMFSPYLYPLPKDPGGGSGNCNDEKGENYCCLRNRYAENKYCIWAELEQGGFFAASEKGTSYLEDEPSGELDQGGATCW